MPAPLQENPPLGAGIATRASTKAVQRVVKVRRDQKPGDYGDPGWYRHPPGTVAYEYTGALPDPARTTTIASRPSAAIAKRVWATSCCVLAG